MNNMNNMNKESIALGVIALSFLVPHALGDVLVKGQTATKKVVVEEIAQDLVEVRVMAKSSSGAWVVDDDLTSETNHAEATAPELRITADCNENGIDDADDISAGVEDDIDADGRPDSCEIAVGDVNLNGVVNHADVNTVLGWWGLGYSPTSDANFDGMVDGHDLAAVLAGWGTVE